MTTPLPGAWLRVSVLALVIVAAAVLATTVGLPTIDTIRSTVDAAGGAGWALIVVGLALLLLGPVPRSATSVLIGLVLGFGAGAPVAFAGGLLGAVVAFGLSRTLGRSAALRLAGPRLTRVDLLMTDRAFTSVLLGRLLPVLPFVAVSYGAGLLGIRFVPYLAATAVGLVPSTVVQVGFGASAGFFASGGSVLAMLPAAAGAAVLSVLAALAWRQRRATSARAARDGTLAPTEQPAEHAAGAAHRARGQLQDRPARDARHLLRDRSEREEA
jgi:uncharacterized membrane protein YdjX (TVP38/TMEM64 family)